MKGHAHVTLSSRQVAAVLGDSDVLTCAAWWTGHSHPLLGEGFHHLLGDLNVVESFFGWSGKLAEPLSMDSLSSDCGSFHLHKGARYTSLVGY